MSKVAYGRKPLGWFVRRNDTGMLKCTDGKWRHNAGAIENIKIWKHSTNALKYGERGVPDQGELGGVCFSKVTAHAVYDDEPIDCIGRTDSQTPSDDSKRDGTEHWQYCPNCKCPQWFYSRENSTHYERYLLSQEKGYWQVFNPETEELTDNPNWSESELQKYRDLPKQLDWECHVCKLGYDVDTNIGSDDGDCWFEGYTYLYENKWQLDKENDPDLQACFYIMNYY